MNCLVHESTSSDFSARVDRCTKVSSVTTFTPRQSRLRAIFRPTYLSPAPDIFVLHRHAVKLSGRKVAGVAVARWNEHSRMEGCFENASIHIHTGT